MVPSPYANRHSVSAYTTAEEIGGWLQLHVGQNRDKLFRFITERPSAVLLFYTLRRVAWSRSAIAIAATAASTRLRH